MQGNYFIQYKDTPMLRIWMEGGKMYSEEIPNDIKYPLTRDLYPDRINIPRFIDWCKTRVVPETRDGIEDLLRNLYKVKEYNPVEMCFNSHALQYADHIWLRQENENLRWNDVNPRRA